MAAIGCKKVVASGARTTVLWMEERCFGIPNAKVSDSTIYLGTWKRLEITSESVVNEIGTLQSNALNPSRSVKRRQQGTSAPGGDLNVELANNGYGYLITQAVGKIIGAGTSGDPYTILPVDADGVARNETAGYLQDNGFYNNAEIHYEASESAGIDSAGFECGYYEVDDYGLEPGFTLMISRDGGTIRNEVGAAPTNHLWFQYLGMKVNVWSITAPATDLITGSFGLFGRQEVYNLDVPIPTYVERPEINDPFTGFNANVEIDAATLCVLSWDMTLTNNLGTDQHCLGDRYRNSLPEGQKVIEGTITIEFSSLEEYKKFIDGTSSVFTIEFDLFGDGAETLKVILPKLEYNGTTPTAAGQEAINQELPYLAMWDDSPADSLLVKGATAFAPNGFDIAVEIVTAGTLI